MASNLSSIGFTFADEATFREAIVALADMSVRRLRCRHGEYGIWQSPTGAEIWFHLEPGSVEAERNLVGLTPYFEGESDVSLRLTSIVRRPDDNAFEGAFHAEVLAGDDAEAMAYPLVFDAADFAAFEDLDLPKRVRGRLVGFARELDAYPDEQAFSAATEKEFSLAAKSFIPLGLFLTAGKNGEARPPEAEQAADEPEAELPAPSSNALLCGKVIEHEVLREPEGGEFHWLLVESLTATYDIVADPEVVSGDIVRGGYVKVGASLVGRLLTT